MGDRSHVAATRQHRRTLSRGALLAPHRRVRAAATWQPRAGRSHAAHVADGSDARGRRAAGGGRTGVALMKLSILVLRPGYRRHGLDPPDLQPWRQRERARTQQQQQPPPVRKRRREIRRDESARSRSRDISAEGAARTWRGASALELEVIRPGHAAAGQLREAAERRPSVREPSPRPTPAAGLAESSHERAAASPCTARPISPLRGPPHDCTPAADERRRLALRH